MLLISLIAAPLHNIAQGRATSDSLRQQLETVNQEAFLLYNSDPAKAIQLSKEVVKSGDSASLFSLVASAYKNIGLAFWRRSAYDSSLFYYEMGKALSDSIGDELTGSKILNNMALVYRDRGQYATALDYYLEALEIQKRLEALSSLSITLTNVGAMYFRLGQIEESKDYLAQSLQMAQANDLALPECFGCSVAVEVYTSTNEFDKAEEHYLKALSVCEKVSSKYYIGLAMYNYGLALKRQKKRRESMSAFEKSLEVMREVGDLKKQTSALNQIAIVLYEFNQLSEASVKFEQVQEMASQHSFLEELQSSYQYLSDLRREEGNDKEALFYFQKFYDVSDSLTRRQNFYALSEINIKYDTQQKENENQLLRAETRFQNEVIQRQQLRTNLFYIIIASSILAIVSLSVFVVLTRRKNSRLKLLNAKIQQQSTELETRNQELHQRMEELSQTQQQLVESEKMASLGALSAGIGHEINNPLNFISGGIDLLSKHYRRQVASQDELAEKYFQAVNEGVERASSIVRSLSHFSRQGDDMDEACDVYDIIDNCLVILENRLKHRVKVTKDYTPDRMVCRGNNGRIHQAFLNVLANAEQAIADEGEIWIKGSMNDGVVKVEIKDSGKGINQDHLHRIMDPFFTTKGPGEGTGLGLSISYRIIEEHQGSISLDSELGRGTTVTIILPRDH